MLFKLPLLGVILPLAAAQTYCPLVGHDYAAPQKLSSSKAFQAALGNFTALLAHAHDTRSTSYGPLFDGVNTSYSVEIFSTHESKPLFTTHSTAPSVANSSVGVKKIDSNTVYRVGSITKAFTVWTFLIHAGDSKFNDPITKYIPELKAAAASASASQNPIDSVSWNDVTIGELASQKSGIGRDYAGFGELAGQFFPDPNPLSHGLPPLSAADELVCVGGADCTRAKFFAGFTKRHPVYPSATAPIYSNAAFMLLAYALENITGKDFPTLANEAFIQPLNLTGSSWQFPMNNDMGIVVPGSAWGMDLGDETAAGGMYSTITDLSTIGRSILTSSLLPPALTRRWLQPTGIISVMNKAVGAPWEIHRIQPSSISGITDLYAKSGDLPGYSAQLIMIPEWDMGFSILAAGKTSNPDASLIANMITDVVLPAVHVAAREEADAKYCGTYVSIDKHLNSSVTIKTDASIPGLIISSWISNGTDELKDGIGAPSTRLWPSGLTRELANGDTEVRYRAQLENPLKPNIGGTFGEGCQWWFGVDGTYYGSVASDEWVITLGKDGKAKSVSPRILRVVLERKK